ncbi:MAG: efflux RND transporter periplasmic adaptor subunit [Wenzhouxiangella sp.]|jgi:membrane fusion protein (multidrug efflux system)|nr:efflux RND transporter periplasmic adaptor subunit [Wenzhouxiangella sp.]
MRKNLKNLGACLALGVILTGCEQEPTAPAPPPVGVGVYEIEPVDINQEWRLSARTEALDSVDVQARVQAEVTGVLFDRGTRVEAGQILFQLDDQTQREQLRQAQAQVESARSSLQLAERNLARGLEVADQGFLSAADIDKLKNAERQSVSALESAEAALVQAQQNLDYTTIRAPISGRVGDTSATIGNLVGPGSGPLVQLQATDPIVARFQLTDREFMQLVQQRNQGFDLDQLEIRLILDDDQAHPHPGSLDFVDIEVNRGTGTADVTARFPNPDDTLVPGLFTSVELRLRQPSSQLLVPNQAIGRNQLGQFVRIVTPDNTIAERQITIERELRTSSVVASGLDEGDLVVVEGLQKIRPGTSVQTAMYDWDTATGLLAPVGSTQP